MLGVRLHISASGVWVLCQCGACREVHKYPLDDALASPVECKHCGQPDDIKGAVIEAVVQRAIGIDVAPSKPKSRAALINARGGQD